MVGNKNRILIYENVFWGRIIRRELQPLRIIT